VAASSSVARARRRNAARRPRPRLPGALLLLGLLTVVLLGVGIGFAGHSDTLPPGTKIAGVDVGGLSARDARTLLQGRAARLAGVPVAFTVAGRTFRVTPKELGVSADWSSAVAQAEARGSGFAPVRGYRRLGLRFFPATVSPTIRSYDAAVRYEVGRIAAAVDTPHREARLVRRGLHVDVQAGATGRVVDRAAAAKAIVAALASFSRSPVALPVRVDPPTVTAASLAPARRVAERILSAPVTLTLGPTRWRLPRWRLATMLVLPARPGEAPRLGGAAADAYFAALERRTDTAPVDAGWAPTAGGIRLVAAKPGVSLEVPLSAERIVEAARRLGSRRTAALAVQTQQPSRTTADARAMGITGVVGTYETFYGGDPNRIHNVQLVAHLVDGKLIAPGATFSFNGATGERSASKGFLEAPVIINGELQTGLGGGVCQVSTTVFNAAYEAGLPITARTNHALYISHYPLGRDATVDYPDIDLKFVNDTPHWLLLRTFVGSDSLVVNLYGTPQHRKVETETAPLTVVAPAPVKRVPDPTLPKGETEVVDGGQPATRTSVHRRVYAPDGKLLSDSTWVSSYVSSPRIVHVGTKKPPKAKKKTPPATTAAATTTTATTATQPSQSPPATTTAPASDAG
jgi:vancomycin resistance protein YoaR